MVLQISEDELGVEIARVSRFLIEICLRMKFETYSVGREFGRLSSNPLNAVFPYAMLGGCARRLEPFFTRFEKLGSCVFEESGTAVVELVRGEELARGVELDAQISSLVQECISSAWTVGS